LSADTVALFISDTSFCFASVPVDDNKTRLQESVTDEAVF